MTETIFSEEFPDFMDVENRTGKRPGYSARVWHDGETIGLSFSPVGSDDPMRESGIAMDVAQASSLGSALQKAINSCKKE